MSLASTMRPLDSRKFHESPEAVIFFITYPAASRTAVGRAWAAFPNAPLSWLLSTMLNTPLPTTVEIGQLHLIGLPARGLARIVGQPVRQRHLLHGCGPAAASIKISIKQIKKEELLPPLVFQMKLRGLGNEMRH
jgi:hypothetical protein